MDSLNYVNIPAHARRLHGSADGPSSVASTAPKALPRITTALPHPELAPSYPYPIGSALAAAGDPATPSKAASFNLPAMLLSSALPNMPTQSDPRSGAAAGAPRLLSTRDPLSIPITTQNFRRFVSKIGPVFWLQDRVEEVMMWRKGWKVTLVWMAVYSFLCEA
jgi:hypothetical protein